MIHGDFPKRVQLYAEVVHRFRFTKIRIFMYKLSSEYKPTISLKMCRYSAANRIQSNKKENSCCAENENCENIRNLPAIQKTVESQKKEFIWALFSMGCLSKNISMVSKLMTFWIINIIMPLLRVKDQMVNPRQPPLTSAFGFCQ